MVHAVAQPTFTYRLAVFAPEVRIADALDAGLWTTTIGAFASRGRYVNRDNAVPLPAPHLVEAGEGTMSFGGRTWTVRAGDIFVFFPGHPVTSVARVDRPWRYHWCTLAGPLALPLLARLGFTTATPQRSGVAIAGLAGLLREGFAVAESRNDAHRRNVSWTWRMLAALAAAGRTGAGSDGAAALRHAIEIAPASPLPITAIAAAHGISRSTLHRRFVMATGCAPKVWQMTARLEHARRLLAGGMLPVAEIAAATGFTDAAYFARAFRRRFGVPPRTWRLGR